jgi:NAD-specific glutamate dehydrogenase
MPCVFGLTEVAPERLHVEELAGAYFTLSGRLELDWLRARIVELPIDDRWKLLGRIALRDELFSLQAALAADAIAQGGLESWLSDNGET